MHSHPSKVTLAIIVLFFLATISTAYPVHYRVESGYQYVIPDPPDDVRQLSWWELSVRDIVILSIVAFSPVLLYPLELLYLIKIFLYFGHRRISDKTVLENRMRLEIYSRIREHPGTTAPTIADDLDANLGTVRYHLEILELMRKITSLPKAGFTAYFENRGTRSVLEQKILSYLQNDTKIQIFSYLKNSPGSSRQGIVQSLGISGPAVTWHMKQLMEDHIIIAKQEGKYTRHSLNPEVIPVLEKYLPELIKER